MLQQGILSFITRLVPEAFLVLYSIYKLTNTKVNTQKIFLSSIIAGIIVFIIRLLPIHFGVHTILGIMLYIFLAVKLNKIELHKAITTALVLEILLFVSDFILIIVYSKLFKFSTEALVGKTWLSAIAGIPSLFLFYMMVLIILFFKRKRANHEQH
jgi:branched-subunit amino acid transport protein AzlD